jgi:hypothetical protein
MNFVGRARREQPVHFGALSEDRPEFTYNGSSYDNPLHDTLGNPVPVLTWNDTPFVLRERYRRLTPWPPQLVRDFKT